MFRLKCWNFPGSPVKTPQVWSKVRELRSHMLFREAKKLKKKKKVSVESLLLSFVSARLLVFPLKSRLKVRQIFGTRKFQGKNFPSNLRYKKAFRQHSSKTWQGYINSYIQGRYVLSDEYKMDIKPFTKQSSTLPARLRISSGAHKGLLMLTLDY